MGVTGLIGDWKLWNQMVWVQNLLHHLEAGTWAGCFTSLCLGSVLIKQLSCHFPASPGGSAVKNLPAIQEPQEMWVQSLDRKDPLEGMATHSSILAWRICMDRGAWQATVHRIAKSQTRLSSSSSHFPSTLLPPIPQPPHQVLLIRPPQKPQI